jgi:pyruvate formate lyase activating enzyme
LTSLIHEGILATIAMVSGIIFDIKRYAINDGPGIRTAVFFKGCPLSCWWCHNPEGQSLQPQLMIRQNRCKKTAACLEVCPQQAIRWEAGPVTLWEKCDQCGKCAEVCYAGAREMVGYQTTPEALLREIERDVPFYDQSGGGVTFTGGEPLMQAEFLQQVLLSCKRKGIHTALDTSGHASWEKLESVLPLVDLFLYDVKLIDEAQHRQYTSVSNRLILANLRKLSASRVHLVIRFPLIPGINDDDANLESTAQFLASLPSLDGVELMPYHDIGAAKFQALGMSYKLFATRSPTKEKVRLAEDLFIKYHLPVIRHSGRAI